MTNPPPSAIVAAKEKAFDDLRSLFPKRPPLPSHHVRIEELHDALGRCTPSLKGRISLATLIEVCQVLNAKLDERNTGIRTAIAPELPPVGSYIPKDNYRPRGSA